ncbi:TadE/TadG family type IV pilus assembly protein [Oryzibacter oryziterrae]|uniref:TadE/TadG family type IV pilus assembly protein n=1 Tax=Oryzibacter oryziterrae TaxID=2766474 RepID=UPI001F3D2513|nr:TadE/TadG family type IV pilus assembly protein [Oryzibacter oryziterrae]
MLGLGKRSSGAGKRSRMGMKDLVSDQRGVAATEFALIIPVVIVLMAGLIDVAQALAVNRKLVEISSSVADLVAQRSDISTSDVNAILQGAQAILLPYNTSGLKIIVSVVHVDTQNKVVWAAASGATAPVANSVSTATIPSDMAVNGVDVVAAQVQYTFSPTFSNLFGQSVNFNEQELARPRQGTTVTLK